MSYNFWDTVWVRVLRVGKVNLGAFTPNQNCHLDHMKVFFYKKGSPTGLVRINLHTSPDKNVNFAMSDYIDLADIPDDFIGEVRFDFSKKIREGQKYYVTAEGSGYVSNGDVDYLCFVHDYPNPTYPIDGVTEPLSHPIKFGLFARI